MEFKIENDLQPLQTQRQVFALSSSSKAIVRMLSMDAGHLREYLIAEAGRNPCVELVFPESAAQDDAGVFAVAGSDYRDELILQLPARRDPALLKLAVALIRQLDSYGFLPADPIKAARPELRPLLKTALRLVQSLEPPGVGARSLRECYYLQLREHPPYEKELKELLLSAELFRLYSHGEFDALYDRLSWSKPTLEAVTAALKAMSMHPIEPEPEASSYILPDVEIVATESGFTARLFEHALPHVTLNGAYVDSLQQGGGRFANEGVFYANRLIYCLERRNATLLSLVQYAVARQGAFLKGGAPVRLTMTEAAKALGLNCSTVSRALGGKYAQWNGRVFPCALLFSRSGKGSLSRQAAICAIRELLSAAPPENQPSDRILSEELERRYGVSLSRRTINRYRAELSSASTKKRS